MIYYYFGLTGDEPVFFFLDFFYWIHRILFSKNKNNNLNNKCMAITRILLDSALEIIQRAEEFIVDPTKDETKKQTVSDAIAKLKEQLHEDVDLPLIFFEPVDPTSKVTVDPVPEELQLETKYLYNPIISKAAQKLCDTITCTVHGANIVYRNTRLWGIRMKT
jgi:hypothetical protein